MRIVFATIYDPRDIERGSGTFYHLFSEIERRHVDVTYIGPLETRIGPFTRVMQGIHRRISKRYKTYLDPFVARSYGKQVTEEIAGLDYDLLVTNDPGIGAYTDTGTRPKIVYTDLIVPPASCRSFSLSILDGII